MDPQLTPGYAVKYHVAARREAKGFLRTKQYLFCVEQAKLLRYFPERIGGSQGKFFSLDIKKIKQEEYWEMRIWDKVLEHINVRLMFAVFSQPREIWILSVYPKQKRETPTHVKNRCRKRLRMLRREGYRL